jgi:hypothetical protein
VLYCVFHLEPAPAMTVFISVIPRPFLVFGVFVGTFFFGGAILAKQGHFTPILALKPQNGAFWEVTFCFWPRGRQATALRPAWGSALQPGGRGEPGQAAVRLGVTYMRGYSSVLRGVDRRR